MKSTSPPDASSSRARSTDLTGEEQGREPASTTTSTANGEETSSSGESSALVDDNDADSGSGVVQDQAEERRTVAAATSPQANMTTPTGAAGEGCTAVTVDSALEVEEIDQDLYRSIRLWQPARARGVFGGQVIGMAVASAAKTVRPDQTLHSLHCYFLLAGDRSQPIVYRVERVRDGGSYATRQVQAQQKGRVIFTVLLSYHVPEPRQPTFAIPLPPPLGGGGGDQPGSSSRDDMDTGRLFEPTTSFSRSPTPNSIVASLPSPEDSPLNEQRYVDVLARYGPSVPPKLKKLLEAWIRDRRKSPLEIRNALPKMYDENGLPTAGYEQAFWLRTKEPVKGDTEAQKAALAYASDFQFLSSIPKALENSVNIKMMASLDHVMWFYNDFDVHEWLLFLMQAQAAGHGRGVALGRIYRRDGTLVAVLAQEGMVRENLDKPRKEKL